MSLDLPLYEMLARGASGDTRAREQAYTELVRLITIFVRASMGRRLRDHRESIDVCQSIARSFVDDHAAGKITFTSEGALIAYLGAVVQSKLAMLSRHDSAVKRTPTQTPTSALHAPPPDAPLQSAEVSDQLESLLTDRDREIARLRLAGLEWDDIAARIGEAPQTLRKRWSRLADRLSDDLESHH